MNGPYTGPAGKEKQSREAGKKKKEERARWIDRKARQSRGLTGIAREK